MRKLDRLYEKAKELSELKEELLKLLPFSEVPLTDICKEAGISLKTYYKLKSGESELTSKYLIKLIGAIILLSSRKDLLSTRKEFSYKIKLNGHIEISFNLSEIERKEVAKNVGMSPGSIIHLINGNRKLLPNRAKDILRAIIEIQNYRTTKIEVDGKRNSQG